MLFPLTDERIGKVPFSHFQTVGILFLYTQCTENI